MDVPPKHAATAAGRKDVKLVSVKVGGKALSEGDYRLAPDSLTIPSPPSGSFQVVSVPLLEQAKQFWQHQHDVQSTSTVCIHMASWCHGSTCVQVEIETELKPQDNTSLEGLYKSSGEHAAQLQRIVHCRTMSSTSRLSLTVSMAALHVASDGWRHPASSRRQLLHAV